jgi:ATP phosphoribosyltransferase regulatory subunit
LVDLDLVQPADIYFDLSGEDIRRRLFLLETDGGSALCLRPDQTIPAARAYLAGYRHGQPAALRYEGKVFRKLAAGGDGASEFLQFGVEFIAPIDLSATETLCLETLSRAFASAGWQTPHGAFSDAGLIGRLLKEGGAADAVAAWCQRRFERGRLFEGARVQPDGQGTLAATLRGAGRERAGPLFEEILGFSNIAMVGERSVGDILERLFSQEHHPGEGVLAEWLPLACALAKIHCPLGDACDVVAGVCRRFGVNEQGWTADWARRVGRVGASGFDLTQLQFSAGLARQFNYYDGVVFQFFDRRGDKTRMIAAGGQFHTLFERLGAEAPVEAFGMALRPTRLAKLVEAA